MVHYHSLYSSLYSQDAVQSILKDVSELGTYLARLN